jgi:hypothetical protein
MERTFHALADHLSLAQPGASMRAEIDRASQLSTRLPPEDQPLSHPMDSHHFPRLDFFRF